MAKRKNIGKTEKLPENYDFSYRANGMQRALDNLQKAYKEQDKIYAIYEIAQYCGLWYENPELFPQQSTPDQIAILHIFFLQKLTPTLQFHQNPKNISVWLLKREFTNRNTQFNVFDIFHGSLAQQTNKLDNFIARVTDLIREVPSGTITIGLRKKQEQQRKNINIAVDIYKVLDPQEQDMELLQSIVLRTKERENDAQWHGLDALADLIIVKKKLSIPLSQYTAENTTIEDIYDLLKQ